MRDKRAGDCGGGARAQQRQRREQQGDGLERRCVHVAAVEVEGGAARAQLLRGRRPAAARRPRGPPRTSGAPSGLVRACGRGGGPVSIPPLNSAGGGDPAGGAAADTATGPAGRLGSH